MKRTLFLNIFASAAAGSSFQSIRMNNLSLKKVPASSLHVSKPTHWLESRFHFSFADYWDPARENFGALRVVNDDLVKARNGFGPHPHRDAEIFSYIVDGFLSHADSMGHREQLGRGAVQYLSAGTGIRHAEMNDHPTDTCRFLQIWISPDQRGHAPQYGSTTYESEDRHNKILQVLGGTGPLVSHWPHYHAKGGEADVIRLHQDANVLVSEMDAGVEFSIPIAADRQLYFVQIEGSSSIGGGVMELSARDALRAVVTGKEAMLSVQAGPNGAHWLMVEMKRA